MYLILLQNFALIQCSIGIIDILWHKKNHFTVVRYTFLEKKRKSIRCTFSVFSKNCKMILETLIKMQVSASMFRAKRRRFYRIAASANFLLCFSVFAKSFFRTSLTSRFRKHATQPLWTESSRKGGIEASSFVKGTKHGRNHE